MNNPITQAIEALALILPMAKGYAHQHPVGNNSAFCDQAESALASLRAAQEGDLPPLPSAQYGWSAIGHDITLFTADQMREYARLALAAAGGGVPQGWREFLRELIALCEVGDINQDCDHEGWKHIYTQAWAMLASSPQPEAAHQPVRVGPFSIWNTGDQIAIYCDGGEGGEFNAEQFQKAVEAFYAANF